VVEAATDASKSAAPERGKKALIVLGIHGVSGVARCATPEDPRTK
jgi:hypothetical protein